MAGPALCNTGWCNDDEKYSDKEIKGDFGSTAKPCVMKLGPMNVCTDNTSCTSGKCESKRCTQSNKKHDAGGPCSSDGQCNNAWCNDDVKYSDDYSSEIKGGTAGLSTAKTCVAYHSVLEYWNNNKQCESECKANVYTPAGGKHTEDGPCNGDGDCSDGTFCDETVNPSKCIAKNSKGNMATCKNNNHKECKSNKCEWRGCTPEHTGQKHIENGPCSSDNHCYDS